MPCHRSDARFSVVVRRLADEEEDIAQRRRAKGTYNAHTAIFANSRAAAGTGNRRRLHVKVRRNAEPIAVTGNVEHFGR